MRYLISSDLKLALRDFLGDKLSELRRSATGRQYEPRLRAKQKQIEALPDAADPNTPLAKELGEADVARDGYGAAAFYLCKAIDAHPKLSVALKKAAAEAQETFVPKLDVLRASYADEAAAALDNRPELANLKAGLKSIVAPGGGSLYDWMKDFLAAGDDIDKLLRERAKLLATGENAAGSGPLRGATVGLLGRFRDALRDEIEEEGSTLGAGYDAKLFAYVDKLNADRASRKGGDASGAPAEAPPDAGVGGGPDKPEKPV